jgi:hypothetical protein
MCGWEMKRCWLDAFTRGVGFKIKGIRGGRGRMTQDQARGEGERATGWDCALELRLNDHG